MSGETERISIRVSAAEALFLSFVDDPTELRVLFKSKHQSEGATMINALYAQVAYDKGPL